MSRQTFDKAPGRNETTVATGIGGLKLLHRRCSCGGLAGMDGECEECRNKTLSRYASDARQPAAVPQIVHEAMRSAGQPLDGATRSRMERGFGFDFSGVRIHNDALASASAKAVHADAYAVGSDVVFRSGAYNPHSAAGQRLLAHELAHVVQGRGQAGLALSGIAAVNDPSEEEADRAAEAVISGSPAGISIVTPGLHRYSHEDCSEDDLRTHIWPADHIAREMTRKAIRVLSSSTLPASVTPLLEKYFKAATPPLGTILGVYDKVDAEYRANDYQYECEDDCSGSTFGYAYGIWSDIHLCMNHLRGRPNECIARTMVHEMTHYYAGTDDNGYCKTGCEYSSCPDSLSQSDALDNADSYACFAYELWPMAVP
jgi:hypothetical protein